VLSRLHAGGVGWQQDSVREGYILLTSTAVFDTLSELDVNSIGEGGRLGECTEAGKKLTYLFNPHKNKGWEVAQPCCHQFCAVFLRE